MQRLIALLGWLSFVVWLLSSPGCGGLEDGWRLDGIPEEPVQAALDEWCSVGYCDALNPNGVDLIQIDDSQEVVQWLGIHETRADGEAHRILVSSEVPTEQLRVLLLHELGHHFRGGGHLPPGNVMAHYLADASEHLTELDISGEYWEK